MLRLIYITVFLIFSNVPAWSQLPGYSGIDYYEVVSNHSHHQYGFQVALYFNHKQYVDRGAKEDGSDIRFTHCDGTLIEYWFEYGKNSTSSKVWLRIEEILPKSKETILLHYGNPNASAYEDPDKVFEFFDHFWDSEVNQNKWARSGSSSISSGWLRPSVEDRTWGGANYMYSKKDFSYLNDTAYIECRVRSRDKNASGNIIFYVNDPYDPKHYLIQHDTRTISTGDGDFGFRSGTVASEATPPYIFEWDAMETVFYRMTLKSSKYMHHERNGKYVDGKPRRISGQINPNVSWRWKNIGLSTMNSGAKTFEVDYIWVRKFASPEPYTRKKNTETILSDPEIGDFGWLICESDSTISLLLTNTGDDSTTVKEVYFSVGYHSQYSLAGDEVFGIASGGSYLLNLNFHPEDNGVFPDTVVLVNEDMCLPPVYIPITGLKDNIAFEALELTGDTLDLGNLCLGESKDSSFIIRNNSSIETGFDSNYPDEPFVFMNGNPFSKPFHVEEERAIALSFLGADSEGVYWDTLTVYDTCGTVKNIYIKAIVSTPTYEFEKETIDFGECTLWCDTLRRDTVRIINTSGYGVDGQIEDVIVAGMFANPETAQILIPEGDVILSNSSNEYEIIFSPKKPGEYQDSLKLIINPCGIVKTLYLKGVAKEVGFTALRDGVDFGMLRLNSAHDTTLVFENTGSADLTVENIDGIVTPFELLGTEPALPAVLEPGDSIKIDIKVNITDTIEYRTDIVVSGSPCGFSAQTLLIAKGLPIIADALVYIPNTHAKAGEIIKIPLILESSKNLAQSGIDAFEAVIRMNRTLLKPVDLPSEDDILVGDRREIHIGGLWDNPDGVLYEMELYTALGDSVCTSMEITEFKWLNGLSNVELIDGRFCLVDVCNEGGDRLFDDDFTAGIKNISPNPGNSIININYETIERAASELILYDLTGREIIVIDKVNNEGPHNCELNADALESGLYLLVLKTASQTYTEFINIVK